MIFVIAAPHFRIFGSAMKCQRRELIGRSFFLLRQKN